MKPVKKFSTFEELKSCENRVQDIALSLKNHEDFEKVIRDIRSANVHKNKPSQPKQ